MYESLLVFCQTALINQGVANSKRQTNKSENIPETDLRGDITNYNLNSNVKALNILAKILHRGGNNIKYIAILENVESKKIYLSDLRLTSKPESKWLAEPLKEIIQIIKSEFTEEKVVGNKISLFKALCRSKVTFIQRMLDQQIKLAIIENKDENFGKMLNKLKNGHCLSDNQFPELKNFASDMITRNLRELFNDVFSLVHNFLLDKEVLIVPYEEYENLFKGVHVEAKAVYYSSIKDKSLKFNVGLANPDDKEPGCCTACSSEFIALAENCELEINRSADFKLNYPSQGYSISPSITHFQVEMKFVELIIDNIKLNGTQHTDSFKLMHNEYKNLVGDNNESVSLPGDTKLYEFENE